MSKFDWEHTEIETLSGGSLSSNLVIVARALNKNAEVLKECCNKVDELIEEVRLLKQDKDS